MSNATDRGGPWLRRARAVVVYGIVPAILLGVVYSGIRFKTYVERDPAFCGMCHLQSRAELLWTSNQHGWIVCQDCHHQSERESFRMLLTYTLDHKPPERELDAEQTHRPESPINACESCHVNHDRRWPEVAASTGHQKHLASGEATCLDCHADGIHKFRAALDTCQRCHGERTLRTDAMEKLHCLACHNFSTTEETIKPSQKVCVTCHRSEGVSDESSHPANAPMAKLQCWSCHRPHVEEGSALVACADCHETLHGSHNDKGHDVACDACHSEHRWVTTRAQCLDCHQELGLGRHHGEQGCVECHTFSERGKAAPPP